ncbi:hypothetical protein HMH01_01820 [Halovulum dunhuangense]|uniref:Uncharacterized protein n=1 Tax=Halovulum dunhuangense TaxID=1505036 RepID=A0A849KZJ2_9RHOB|nr:hypothetical protein [Halovulum dunhuangense]NNU79164.1 hypothetical protein [Halovulum dunhuangense]
MRWLVPVLMFPAVAFADVPQILAVEAREGRFGWRFDVTVEHADTGWEHYVDGWTVHLPDGTMLGARDLLHPHVAEQPFTRSLFDVVIPEGTTEVILRANDNLHGQSAEFVYRLPGS